VSQKKQVLTAVLLIVALGLGIWLATLLYRRLSAQLDATPAASTVAAEVTPSPGAETTNDPAGDGEAADPVPAPDFTVLTLEGESVSLSDFAGKPRIVNFWATWCPPCRSELPAFAAAWEEYGDEVEFMMVDLTDGGRETQETVEDFLAETGYAFPVYLDTTGQAANAYGIYSIPVTVLVDAQGNFVGGQVGALREDVLLRALDSLSGRDKID